MSERPPNEWSYTKKYFFLFILTYTFLYLFPFPFDAFPQVGFIFNYYEKVNNILVLFIGKHFFHLTDLKKLVDSDSGDTLFDFVEISVFLIVSLILSLIILLLDKKRASYRELQNILFCYIRYCVGFYMLIYGFDKVFKSHFPFPSLEKIIQPLGESTPQGLLWAFAGSSTSFTVYLGIVEVISSYLLLFRRTMVIGALLVLVIMINVTIVNFSYDVPVKLFALHLVTFIVILLFPYFQSMFNFFIANKITKLPEYKEIVLPNLIRHYRKIIKGIVVVAFSILFIQISVNNMKTKGDNLDRPPLYGIYSTELFIYNSDTTSALQTGDNRWERIVFDSKYTTIVSAANLSTYYFTSIDTLKKKILFIPHSDLSQKYLFNYNINREYLTLAGKMDNNSIQVIFKKNDLNKFPLINRKFHWVVEYPYNN